jgi:hypothetical protein
VRLDELDELLLSNPLSVDPYLVYADQLQADGFLHGELISAQIGLAKNPSDARLAVKERALLERVQRSMLGPRSDMLMDPSLCEMTWHYGFIRSARIRAHWHEDVHAQELLSALLHSPLSRYLWELRVGLPDASGTNHYGGAIEALVSRGPLPFLRRLVLGDVEHEELVALGDLNAGDLSGLWEAVPNLETFEVRCGKLSPGFIDAPRLREATILSCGLQRPAMYRIASARWPAMEKLVLYFGEATSGANCGVRDVERLLDRTDLVSLTHLGLNNAEFADELPAVLARSEVLPQLEWLDLSYGIMTDQGALSLARRRDAFAHLQRIAVYHNHIGPSGRRVLRDAFGDRVALGTQKADDPRLRYVSWGYFWRTG